MGGVAHNFRELSKRSAQGRHAQPIHVHTFAVPMLSSCPSQFYAGRAFAVSRRSTSAI